MRRRITPTGKQVRKDSRIDPVDAVRLYVHEEWTMRRIAERFGVSVPAVSAALRRRQVETRLGGWQEARYLRMPMVMMLVGGASQAAVARHYGISPPALCYRLQTMEATTPTLRREVPPLTPAQLEVYAEMLDGRAQLTHPDAIELALEY